VSRSLRERSSGIRPRPRSCSGDADLSRSRGGGSSAGHSVQELGEPFNARLAAFITAA